MGEEDVYKMEDFSEPTRGRKGAKAGVFWNVERYPFPVNTPSDVIYEKIVSYIRLEFDGDKRTRRNRMFHDILLWRIDNPLERPHPAILVLVSDEVRDDKMFFFKLTTMSSWDYCVFLVDPTENLPQPDSPEWPALLLDQAFSFTEQREEA